MTVESMIRLIAGVFVAASVLLGVFVHPYFFWFSLFVGLNLAQSAFSGWCPMMTFLRRAGVRDGAPSPSRG
ncbi:MAG: rhodanese [Acidobacteria bacterium RIFCSPLOWO2_02_FULL_65_29]|nr:MAG: rhodanese [Acidobacteria bacterium RIFCSPLOWO2_02_FULL_65_29]